MQCCETELHRSARLTGHTCPVGETTVVCEDFTEGMRHWSYRVSAGAGVWSAEEEKDRPFLRFRRQSAGITVTTSSNVVYTPAVFHQLKSVQVALRFTTPEISAGVLIGWQFDGHYWLRVEGDPQKGWRISALKTKACAAAFYDELAVSEPLVTAKPGVWLKIRAEFQALPDRTVLTVWVDKKLVLRAEDFGRPNYLCGEVGFRMVLGEADFAALQVTGCPEKREVPASPEVPTGWWNTTFDYTGAPYPVYEGSSLPLHWMWTEESWHWNQRPEGFGVKADDLTLTGLHCLSQNVDITAELTVSERTDKGRIGLVARWFIPGGWLLAGYDVGEGVWFIEDAIGPDFPSHILKKKGTFPKTETVTLRLLAENAQATLFVEGKPIIRAENLQNTAYGKPGIFARAAALCCRRLFLRHDAPLTEDVVGYAVIPDDYSHYLETLELAPNRLLAVYQTRRFLSEDNGLSFVEDASGRWEGVNASGGYSSLLRRRDGWFIQSLESDGMAIQQSRDGERWETIGHLLPEEECVDEQGHHLCGRHVGSLTEVRLANGKMRLFLPIGFRVYGDPMLFEPGRQIIGHYTKVYYSDDGGAHWTASRCDTRDVVPGYTPDSGSSWTESKVIACADESLRLMVTRFEEKSVCFTESRDGGETWQGLFELKGMPCGRSSHGIAEDPLYPGRYYMAYVRDEPYNRSSLFPRTQLMLAYSEDGLVWRELMLLDRLPYVAAPTSYDLYQFLDPCVRVTESYIHIGYGKSFGAYASYHNAQRAHYMRVRRPNLQSPGVQELTSRNIEAEKIG